MKTAQFNLRLSDGQKDLLATAAAKAHESLSEFLLNSALLRIQQRQLDAKPEDPMKLLSRIYVESFEPARVVESEAREVEALLQADRSAKLKYKTIGKAIVPAAKPR
jgi:hypothetical protein